MPQTSTAAQFTGLTGRREHPASCAESSAEPVEAPGETPVTGWLCFGIAREPYRGSRRYAAYIMRQASFEAQKSAVLYLSLSGRGFANAAVSGGAVRGGR